RASSATSPSTCGITSSRRCCCGRRSSSSRCPVSCWCCCSAAGARRARRASSPRDASPRLTRGASALAHELRAQDEALDPFVAAVDLLIIVREADRLNDRALLQSLIGPL